MYIHENNDFGFEGSTSLYNYSEYLFLCLHVNVAALNWVFQTIKCYFRK